MANKVLKVNRSTGVADSPAYPCIKAEGLCRLRTQGDAEFQCALDPKYCRYIWRKKDAA